MIKFITSTRTRTVDDFQANTLLGQSFQRLAYLSPMEIKVALAAQDGLAAVFNPEIEQAHVDDVLVFIHDDIRIDDWLIEQRLQEALTVFDVIGVAGNVTRSPNQRGWYGSMTAVDEPFIPMGEPIFAVGRLNDTPTYRATAPTAVKLLDGVFMAAKAGTLQQANIRFDPQFHYHHYDLDFSRQCEQASLRLGVWPIALTHAPTTGDLSQTWFDSGSAYLKKWGD